MKRISFLFAFVAMFATASFASTVDVKSKSKIIIPVQNKKTDLPRAQTCSVTASWKSSQGGTSTVKITNTCSDCTMQQACDGAYALLSLVIPDKAV